MLRWMCGKTRYDKIINDNIRETVEVGTTVEKIVENILRWFGHVKRISVDYKIIREIIKKDFEIINLNKSVFLDKTLWRKLIHVANPTLCIIALSLFPLLGFLLVIMCFSTFIFIFFIDAF